MKKIIFLVDFYYPNPSPNVICVKRIIDELKHDYEIFCITSDKDRQNTEYELIDGIHVYRTKKGWEYVFLPFCEGKISEGVKIFKIINFIGRCFNFTKNILYLPIWPISSIGRIVRYYRKAEQLIGRYQIDQVVAVNYPTESLFAAKRLKLKYGNNLLVMGYILDFTLLGRIGSTKIRKKLNSRSAIGLESSAIKYLDNTMILSSTQKMYKKIFEDMFDNKITIVDVPLISNKVGNAHPNKSDLTKINIVYTGIFIKNERDPKIIFDLLDLLDISIRKCVTINVYGNNYEYFASWDRHSLQKYNIVIHGQVSEEAADNALINADILLNLGNDLEYSIPSKLFKYISSQKPIIHVSPSNSDACLPLLRKYHKATIIDIELANQNMLGYTDILKETLTNLTQNQDLVEIDVEKTYPMSVPKYTADIIRNFLLK